MATTRITAKWNGKCAGCGKPTIKDSTVEYDWEAKKAYHPECRPGVGNPRAYDDPGEESGDSAAELADRLRFVSHAEAIRPDRPLFLLSSSDRGAAARWD